MAATTGQNAIAVVGIDIGKNSFHIVALDDRGAIVLRQKPESAQGIAVYISNSPFVWWLSIFGIRGEADLLGIIELTTAVILAAGAFIPILSALGSLMGVGTFAITWSLFFSTPGVVRWSISTDPIAWNLTGEFLFKDVVLLCVCIVLFLASLPKRVVPLRSN